MLTHTVERKEKKKKKKKEEYKKIRTIWFACLL
uniref:Uncharacterized protein n=1 Tax=Anguilla anguilla TaxID=7936 RepID=A0A0E9Q8F6_ANGAN